MQPDHPRARIDHRGGAFSRAKELAAKAWVYLAGVVLLASALVVSVAFLAIGFALVLAFGLYLWWQTRQLRRQARARIPPQRAGQIIEGELISREEGKADRR